MRHQRIIIILAGLLAVLTANAGYTVGTVTLKNNGSDIVAEALIDNGNNTVIIGNGQNACIPHYTTGTITIPDNLCPDGSTTPFSEVIVGQLAFRLCNQLTEIVVGMGVTRIGDFAFVGCSSLQKVTLPATLLSIGGGAFVNLPSLTAVTCNATTAPSWLYNDVFAYEGTPEATSRLASQRTLYVKRGCTSSYQLSKYDKTVGWEDAFGRISEATAPSQVLEIASFDELETLGTNVNNGTNNYGDYIIRLTADLEYNGNDRNGWRSWVPIGTENNPFKGVFDGGGHIIKNVKNYGSSTTNVGLFGYTETASISNLVLQNVSMQATCIVGTVVGTAVNTLIHDILVLDAKSTDGSTTYYCAKATDGPAGGLVGYAKNTNIDDCYFYGKVSGTTAVGGIVGSCSEIVSISDCASAYSVEGTSSIGGIVGMADIATAVQRSYSRSTLGGSASNKGGIVGYFTQDGNGHNGIASCAWFDVSGTMPVANSAVTNGYMEVDNHQCASVADMAGDNLLDLLGDEQWHYFHNDQNECPIPASLAEQYLQWAGIKNSDGIIFLAIGNPVSSYTIVGYEGTGTDITLPTTFRGQPVTAIAARAFEGAAVTSVTIPNSITSIGTKAFAGCDALTTLSIGSDVATAYNGWLDGCQQLTNISVATENTAYTMEEGILYNMGKTMLIRCGSGLTGTVTVPSTVTDIAPGAFANCENLAIVDLRNTTTEWRFDRRTATSPFFDSSKYTLFIMNDNTNFTEVDLNEPNVVFKWSRTDYYYYCPNLLVTDRFGFNSPLPFKAKSVSYDRVFAPNFIKVQDDEDSDPRFEYQSKAYTINVPFAPRIAQNEGIKLYTYSGLTTDGDVTIVNFTEVYKESTYSNYYGTKLTHPYLMVVESGDPFTLTSKTGVETSISKGGGTSSVSNDGYSFIGVKVGKSNDELYDAQHPTYILQSDGNWHKVPQNQPKACVGPFRCFFRAESAGAPLLTTHFTDGDDTQGITVVRTTDRDGSHHYYDLNGRRLNGKPQQGLYIYNGKTYISK